MRKVFNALWVLLVLVLMVFVVNYASNESMIKAYNNGIYEKNRISINEDKNNLSIEKFVIPSEPENDEKTGKTIQIVIGLIKTLCLKTQKVVKYTRMRFLGKRIRVKRRKAYEHTIRISAFHRV